MAGMSSSSDQDEFSGINVTPLVDVVLVLLVIFMITAPTLYQQAMKVNLPEASQGEGQSKGLMQVYMDDKGIINVESKNYDADSFAAMVKSNKPASAIIMADKKTEHGRVIQVLDILKASGVNKFSFGVEKR